MTPLRKTTNTRLAGLLMFVLLGSSALPAQAYLDPGSGSLIIQSIIGGVAALGITLKLYWHKIRVKFGAKPSDDADPRPKETRSDTD